MAAVRWSISARQDLGTLTIQLGQYSPDYAATFLARILVAAQQLEDFPRSGRVVQQWGVEYARELLVGQYRIVYLIDTGEPEVIGVAHASQDILVRFGDDPRNLR